MPPEESLRLTRRAAAAGLASLAACAPTRLEPLTGPPRGRVILLRGLANVFSTGLNFLTARLRQVNFDASVHNYLEWDDLADGIAQADRAGTLENRLVNGESHLTIEKQERLHREVIALLQSLAAEREARAAQLAPPSPQMPPGPPIRAGR